MNDQLITRLGGIPRGIGGHYHDLISMAIDEILRLRTERDDARRLYCEEMSRTSGQQDTTPAWWAEEMGWDGLYDPQPKGDEK